MSEHDEPGEVTQQLRWLAAANRGMSLSDDEMISAVCESAIETIERMQAALRQIEDLPPHVVERAPEVGA